MEIFIGRDFARQHLPKRPRNAHKGLFGTLTILAGCSRYRGAAVLAAAGALRAGAGIVRVASTETVCAAVAAQLPCCILQPLAENPAGGISGGSLPPVLAEAPAALLAGCGLSATADTATLITGLLASSTCPLVLDADALNVLAGHFEAGPDPSFRTAVLQALAAANVAVILTPHIREMARLAEVPTQTVLENPSATANAFAAAHHCIVVLKSHTTIIAAPNGDTYCNEAAGGPALAKGGSGDVLAGIIASLLAQGLLPAVAAATGVWLHAAAADNAAAIYGEAGFSPADLPQYLAFLLQELGR